MDYKPAILYVEDEEVIRIQLSKFLKYSSSKLYVAEDGYVGFELFKKYLPDIVVSDIKMPKMNGIDMVKAIKEINPKQHVIFTTAHSESGFFMNAIEAQVDGYILKPIDLDLLEEKIEHIKEQINIKRELKRQYAISNEIARLQKNLLVVLDERHRAIFSNDKFINYFHVKNTKEFFETYKCLSSLFIEHHDFFYPTNKHNDHWIHEIENLKSDERVVSILNLDTAEPEAFLISITNIQETSHLIITLTEVTSLSIEKKKFERKAYTDNLTRIPNRAYFEEEFDKEIARYKRENRPLSFIILDIDKFKNLNDTYGHQIGDIVLKDLATIINEKTREIDVFARWGGEEFVKILPNTSLKSAKIVAENLRIIVENHIFTNNLKVTCSFGIAEFNEDDTKDSAMKRADEALYRAKERGRNRIEG